MPTVVLSVLLLAGLVLALGGCARPPATGPAVLASPHFRDGVFHNQDPAAQNDKSFFDVLKWRLTSARAAWPDHVADNATPDVPARVDTGLRITLINHASFLIQADGLNILTDPVFTERASPFSFAGPKRARAPGIDIDALPPIDAVLISHSHYDHFDQASLKKLHNKFKPHFIVPLRNRDLLPDDARVSERDWGGRVQLNDHSEVIVVTAQHWTARGLFDRNQRQWGAFLLRLGKDTPRRVYFAGDTGYNTHFKMLREEYGPVNVALLPIGAYEPRWFMRTQHMNPADAVQAHFDLGARQSIGMHFGTFQLTDEAIDAPVLDLATARDKAGLDAKAFVAPRNGETFIFE